MKKILFVINTMGRAGAEKSLVALLKTIDYTKYSVSLLSVINRGELFSAVPPEVRIINKNPDTRPVLGVRGAWYIAFSTLGRMLRRGYIFKFIPYAVKGFFRQAGERRIQPDKLMWLPLAETTPAIDESYDLAIAFIEGAATYYLARKVEAEKKVAFVHIHYGKAGYKRDFDEAFYRKMDYICCISKPVADAFKSVYPEYENIRLFPNIIDAGAIRAASQEADARRVPDWRGGAGAFDSLRILTVGRLNPQKGYDVAIPAFARLAGEGCGDIRWYVLGDGAEKPKLEKLIRRYKLDGRFVLLGSRENPYPYMKACDIYVQPSRFEGFPLALQEALILNKPCITANFEGASDLLENGKNAIIIELSENSLYEAVKMMADDAGLRDRIAAATKDIVFASTNEIGRLYDLMDGKEWAEEEC